MNVIISNKNQRLFENLNIEVIKSLNGEFDVDDIVNGFKNFFFQKMILDITALKDYSDIKTVQKLSLALDMNKVILVLDENSNTVSPEFMSQLISLGIYNFTTTLEGIMYLYNSPNTYRDVAHLHIIDLQVNNVQGQPNTNVQPQIVYVERPVQAQQDTFRNRVIGIKNVTKQAGATTLAYMMKKMLSRAYSVAAIEVENSDFKYFNDKELVSATSSNISGVLKRYEAKDVVLIDINKSKMAEELCSDIIYLIEPSTVKLNKLMISNSVLLKEIQNKKIILNQSLLSESDVKDFEYESKFKVFYNLPPLDERKEYIPGLVAFLNKLGFTKIK